MKAKYYRFIFAAFVLLYIGLTFIPSPAKATLTQYHLTPIKARILSISVVLPVIAIWLTAMYGFVRIKDYAQLIKKSKDGRAINTISMGLLFLALGSPVVSVINSSLALLLRQHPNWINVTTIINNYVALAIMAAGLFYIARGGEQLAELVRKKQSQREQHVLVLFFIALSTLYSYFIVSQPINTLQPRAFYMPHWLVLLTIAVPYLYFWYRGLLGAYYIRHYQRHIQGQVYKRSLGFVAGGIALVIFSSIVIRLLATLTARLLTLHLTPLLFIIYGLLFLTALGYVAIAIGAKKLRKIEVV